MPAKAADYPADMPCIMRCGGRYRFRSRTDFRKMLNPKSAWLRGLCPVCEAAKQARDAETMRMLALERAVREELNGGRDAEISALIERLALSDETLEEICEFVLRKRERVRDEEDSGVVGGGR